MMEMVFHLHQLKKSFLPLEAVISWVLDSKMENFSRGNVFIKHSWHLPLPLFTNRNSRCELQRTVKRVLQNANYRARAMKKN